MHIEIYNAYSQVVCTDEEAEMLGDEFSKLHPQARYMRQYKAWQKSGGAIGWNGLVRMLDKSRRLATGMVPRAVKFLSESGVQVSLSDARPSPLATWDATSVKLRNYQSDAVQQALSNEFLGAWWPRGVLGCATGAGKTETAVALYQVLDQAPSIFLVHRRDLMRQAIERFAKFGVEAGAVGNNRFDIRNVTVSTVQSIIKGLEHKVRGPEILRFLDMVKVAFFDEAHLIANKIAEGNQFVKVSALMPNAFFRWGLTATPFMRDDLADWYMMGVTGELIYEKKTKPLTEEGWLVPAKVRIKTIREPLMCAKKWPDCYSDGIVLNRARNQQIARDARAMPKPVLILTDEVTHAEFIHARIPEFALVHGGVSEKDRAEIIAGVARGEVQGIVATTIFDEGVDMPNIRSLIPAGGKKSQVKTIQRIGRGLRKAEGKDVLQVVDYLDLQAKVLEKHSRARIRTYVREGHEVEVE